MASQFLTVLSIMLVGTSIRCHLDRHRKGRRAINFVLINDLIHVWLIVIPSAPLAAFVFHAPPVVVFAVLKLTRFSSAW